MNLQNLLKTGLNQDKARVFARIFCVLKHERRNCKKIITYTPPWSLPPPQLPSLPLNTPVKRSMWFCILKGESLSYRVNLYTKGWIFILQGEYLYYSLNLYPTGWIFILQSESLYYRGIFLYYKGIFYTTGWIFILQGESLSYWGNIYTGWIFNLQGESLSCRVNHSLNLYPTG